MQRSIQFKVAVLFFIILSQLGISAPVAAVPPSAVELISFELTPLDNAVRIDWETGTEQGSAGFKITRGNLPTDQSQSDLPDIGIIPAEGSPALGAEYSVTDLTAVNGQTYYYRLVEITESVTEAVIASGSVVPGLQPTPTPNTLPTLSSPTNTPQPGQATNTPTPTATQTATVSNTSTATPNGSVAATPTTTASATPTPTAANTSEPAEGEPTNTPPPSATPLQDNEGIAFAQGEDEQTGYPGPESTLPPGDTGYPEGAPTSPPTTNDAPPTSYPAATNTPNDTNIPVIGSQDETSEAGETAGDTTEDGSGNRGLGLLWIGFIIAFLIFAAGVVGSIYFFARKQET